MVREVYDSLFFPSYLSFPLEGKPREAGKGVRGRAPIGWSIAVLTANRQPLERSDATFLHNPWHRGPTGPMDAICPSAPKAQAPAGILESTAPPARYPGTYVCDLSRSPLMQIMGLPFLISTSASTSKTSAMASWVMTSIGGPWRWMMPFSRTRRSVE